MNYTQRLFPCFVLMVAFLVGCLPPPKKEMIDDKKSKEGKAKVGVGKKGEGYGNNVPYLKPAATLWKAKEKIVFEIAIPKSMQLFEALNGRKPKTHDEFMTEIIKKGQIKLPELDKGLEYFYDGKKGELMVRNEAAKKQAQ